MANAAAAPPGSSVFSIPLLEVVKGAQAQNGLRHGDYVRYREYCSRRLRRLRRGLKWLHGRRNYRKKTIDAKHAVTDERFLMIPLVLAERSWSYAMQLKQECDEDEDGGNSRKRAHIAGRLSKAAHWSRQLVELCAEAADARTQLEAEAYSAYMTGNVCMQREQWPEALKSFTHAKNVYTELGKVSDREQQALCEEHVSNNIMTSIRYVSYVIKRVDGDQLIQDAAANVASSNALLRSKLEDVITQSAAAEGAGSGGALSSVTWRDTKVPIKNDKTKVLLREALALMDQEQKDVADFQRVFSAFDEALQSVRHDIKHNETGSLKGATNKFAVDNLRKLEDFIAHRKLQCTVKRLLMMVDAAKPEDAVHIYDKLIATELQIADLIDARESETHKATEMRYRAHRCLHVAETLGSLNRWLDAHALFDRALERCAQAEQLAVDASALKELRTRIEERKSLAYALALKAGVAAANTTDDANTANKPQQQPLVDRLERFESGPASEKFNIASLPPSYRATPCKPVLFDLALNYIAFPDVSSRVSASPAAADTSSENKQGDNSNNQSGDGGSGGWFGWMTGKK